MFWSFGPQTLQSHSLLFRQTAARLKCKAGKPHICKTKSRLILWIGLLSVLSAMVILMKISACPTSWMCPDIGLIAVPAVRHDIRTTIAIGIVMDIHNLQYAATIGTFKIILKNVKFFSARFVHSISPNHKIYPKKSQREFTGENIVITKSSPGILQVLTA